MATVVRLDDNARRPTVRPRIISLRCCHDKTVAQLHLEQACVIIKSRDHHGDECYAVWPLAVLLALCEQWRAGGDVRGIAADACAAECGGRFVG